MKNKILGAVAVTCLLAFASNQGRAGVEDTLVKVIGSASNNQTAVNLICHKASVKNAAKNVLSFNFKGLKDDFSIRSSEGRLCSSELIGSFALTLCKGKGDFDQSGCAKKATVAMKGQLPATVLAKNLKSVSAKVTQKVKGVLAKPLPEAVPAA